MVERVAVGKGKPLKEENFSSSSFPTWIFPCFHKKKIDVLPQPPTCSLFSSPICHNHSTFLEREIFFFLFTFFFQSSLLRRSRSRSRCCGGEGAFVM